MKKYGFYSASAISARLRDVTEPDGPFASVWRTPDGRDVLISGTSYDPLGSDLYWPDKVPVGEVAQWVRSAEGDDYVNLRPEG